ncbi:MAG: hydroxyacid dehydrogenase [Sphaerochaeta sp.]|nr:hydroxyacid dehydrogenase [Sphaerochaeta sp.]
MSKIVLIPSNISEPGKDFLRERGYIVKMGSGIKEDQIIADVVGVDAILSRNEKISKNILDAADTLKVISKHGVGLDNIDLTYAEQKGIWVTNGPHSNTLAVAERTLGLLIDAAKRTVLMDRLTRQGDFEARNRIKGMDIEGKVLGIIGLGRIGTLVAKKACYGLGMKVIGYDPFLSPDKVAQEIEFQDSVDDVWSKADFVSLHLPSTPDTQASIGMEQFSLMKRSAILINCARGDVVREKDLIEALQSGVIAGAALDVFEKEPPAQDNPLLKMDNVTLSPHNASLTNETTDRMGLHAAMGIHEILSGKKASWAANKPSSPRQIVED